MSARIARLRWVGCAALAAVMVALVPGPAGGQGVPASSSLLAMDGVEGEYETTQPVWAGPAGGSSVTIVAGGTVSFAYQRGATMHNANFEGRQPVCTQTAGPVSGSVPPLPARPSGPGWAGSCTFSAAGVYQVFCGMHPDMRATITVQGTATSPGTSPPPPPPPPPAAGVPSAPGPQQEAQSPAAQLAPAASALRVASPQRGAVVRGSLQIARPGSRLEVRALVRGTQLRARQGSRLVRVGRVLRPSVGGRRVTFAVALNAAARRVLARSGRLAVTLQMTVTPQTGDVYRATRAVVVRRAAGRS